MLDEGGAALKTAPKGLKLEASKVIVWQRPLSFIPNIDRKC